MATNNQSNGKAKRQNFVSMTLQAGAEAEVKYAASGKPWGKVRAFFSQGKNDAGEFRPSMWFTVKAFGKTDQIEGAVAALQNLAKGDKFTAKGKLELEEWEGNDGVKHQSYVITFASIEPFVVEAEQPADEAVLEGEPA
jgi:single-stranded DNA-binding protein